MQGKRTDRVGHLIQIELSQLIVQKLKDPRLGFVTVTHVEVSPDLKWARVFYSVIGDEKKRKSTQEALQRAAGFLQREIGSAIKIRYTPKLTFVFDDSLDRGQEIDRVIHKLDAEKNQKFLDDRGET